MKIDAFYFRWLGAIFKLKCSVCRRPLGQTLQVVFDARPGGEWEASGRCKECGADLSIIVKASQIVGEPGNKTIEDFEARVSQGAKKWLGW